jgi:hypothetical protein
LRRTNRLSQLQRTHGRARRWMEPDITCTLPRLPTSAHPRPPTDPGWDAPALQSRPICRRPGATLANPSFGLTRPSTNTPGQWQKEGRSGKEKLQQRSLFFYLPRFYRL